MTTKHRPGSMAAADAKSEKTFNAVFTVILLILVGITVFPSGTFFHQYYQQGANIFKVFGFIAIVAWVWLVWFKLPDLNWGGGLKGIVMFGGIAVILLLLFGFNLSL